jgi:hypothetical protein
MMESDSWVGGFGSLKRVVSYLISLTKIFIQSGSIVLCGKDIRVLLLCMEWGAELGNKGPGPAEGAGLLQDNVLLRRGTEEPS